MFAVIKTGGKQYRVSADDTLTIDRIAGEVGDMIEIGHVLAYGEGDDVTFGAPFIEGARVTAEVVEHGRAKTVIAFKKRRRQNSRRKRGQRHLLSTVRISEILAKDQKPSRKAGEKPAEKAEAAPAKPKAAKAAKADAPATLFTAPEGKGDDLAAIKGIGPVAAGQLNEQGLTTFAQLAALTDEDIARIDAAMPFSTDQIRDWREQAAELAK